MHADDHQFVGILRTKSAQLRDIMVAIDSAEGPELQQHNLAAQFAHGEWTINVKPI
jgi:hypothetical protein